MKIIDLKNSSDYSLLKSAAEEIKDGKLVIFPTETVYGLGADGLNENAVNNIFIAKGRKTDNPLILHVSSIDMVYKIADNINEIEKKLMDNFFPGPLTIVLNKKECVPNIVTGNLDTVGVRMPSSIIARTLIEYASTPIAAPSANISGRPSGTIVEDIIDEFNGKVDTIIDGGSTKIGVESTVVRVINNEIHILRPGYITKEDLETIGVNVIIEKHILSDIEKNDVVMSPGMKYKHYAPKTKCILVYSSNKDLLIKKMQELEENNKNSLVVTKDENIKYFKNTINMGSTLNEISHNIFRILREVDKKNVDFVIIEGVEKSGLGLAIMNRLIRACSHNYIEL